MMIDTLLSTKWFVSVPGDGGLVWIFPVQDARGVVHITNEMSVLALRALQRVGTYNNDETWTVPGASKM